MFISHSAPDIRRKLRQLEKDPETPQRDLLDIAFKVFNNREEEARREKECERKAKYAFLAAAIKGRNQPGPSHPRTGLRTPPPRTLLPVQPVRTLGKGMPKLMAPTKACPTCGHWKMDCPKGHPGPPGEVPTSQTWRVECPQGHPGASGEIPTSPQNPSPTLQKLFQ